MAAGGPTRFTDSAWEQVIPWSEKLIIAPQMVKSIDF
jgi:hypothetical protein